MLDKSGPREYAIIICLFFKGFWGNTRIGICQVVQSDSKAITNTESKVKLSPPNRVSMGEDLISNNPTLMSFRNKIFW